MMFSTNTTPSDVRVNLPKIGECKVIEIRHVSDPRYCEGIVGKIQTCDGRIRSVRFSLRNNIVLVPYVKTSYNVIDFSLPPIVAELQHKALSQDYPSLFPRNRDYVSGKQQLSEIYFIDNEIADFGPLLEEYNK